MSNNHRQVVEERLARVAEDRSHGPTLDDVPDLIAAYRSPDEEVRASALRRSCPCHTPWEVYEQLRKPALRLRKDPSPAVRRIADHLEQDARELADMEADARRYAERDEQLAQQFKPSNKRSKRPSRRRPKRS